MPALQAVDGSCKRSSNEIIPAEAYSLLELPTAEDDGQAFCSGPAGSELEHLLAKTEAAWLIERPGRMSTLRLRQQRPRAALEMLRK